MANMMTTLGRMGTWIALLGLGPLGTTATSPGWKAGVARVDTTPTEPVRMAGYGSRTELSQGVAHPLGAKALALADARGHKIVFITCDIIAFRRAFSNRVAERIKMKYGLPREDVALFASHNHAGPALSEPIDQIGAQAPARANFQSNLDYTRNLEDKLLRLVGEAIGRMEPARLSYGVGRAHFALNRREPTLKGVKLGKNPAGPTDESVPILSVQHPSGKPLAIVFGYACHNTTLRSDMLKIAADFAGYAQDRIEADYPGATALFVTGCAGDADPHPFGTLEMAKEHGEALGSAVKFVLDRPMWLTELSGLLRASFVERAIHFAGPTDRASYEKLGNDSNSGRRQHARRMIEAIDQGRPVRSEYPHYSVQAFALGNQLTLVALSGEVVVDYAVRLQQEQGGKGRTLWVAAYANDVVGYIPSLRVLREGGYEGGEAFYSSTWPLPLADDIESVVVNAARDVVQKVREK
jgi:hypothetical protein